MKRYSGIRADGVRCERLVGESQEYCYSHDESRASERSRNASKAAKVKAGEVGVLKAELRELLSEIKEGVIEKGRGHVLITGYGVLLRYCAEERAVKETQELAAELEELKREIHESRGWTA
jgi:hypothetical protein